MSTGEDDNSLELHKKLATQSVSTPIEGESVSSHRLTQTLTYMETVDWI